MPFARVFARQTILFSLLPVMILFCRPPASAAESKPGPSIKCNIHREACVKNLRGGTVSLDISPKPVKAMKELTFTLKITGAMPDSPPFIDLGMPGMRMGPNRVRMQSRGKGLYTGKGVIVRCPSGKRIWKADVTLPGLEKVTFVFDVIY